MPKAGYITIRMSLGRIHAMDAIRIAMRYLGPSADQEGARLTDQQCIDFALDWTLASIPERFTVKQAEYVLRALKRHGWRTQSDDRLSQTTHDVDMSALADRVKESHASVTRDEDPRDGHAFQQQEGNGCELCGRDEDDHPVPF